jgi:hypothetical protein
MNGSDGRDAWASIRGPVSQDPTHRLLYRLMAENRQHARLSEDRRIAVTAVAAQPDAELMARLRESVEAALDIDDAPPARPPRS